MTALQGSPDDCLLLSFTDYRVLLLTVIYLFRFSKLTREAVKIKDDKQLPKPSET
jgi:hypothetical protein